MVSNAEAELGNTVWNSIVSFLPLPALLDKL
jgi:hypothetical protein